MSRLIDEKFYLWEAKAEERTFYAAFLAGYDAASDEFVPVEKHQRLQDEFRHWIDKATAAEAEVQRLRAGLEKVKALEGMTLRCDPADYDFDAEEAFDGGAVNAFCRAADIAKDTLSPLNDCKHENLETESRPGCTYCLDCHARMAR